jgi:hypothetical protein
LLGKLGKLSLELLNFLSFLAVFYVSIEATYTTLWDFASQHSSSTLSCTETQGQPETKVEDRGLFGFSLGMSITLYMSLDI